MNFFAHVTAQLMELAKQKGAKHKAGLDSHLSTSFYLPKTLETKGIGNLEENNVKNQEAANSIGTTSCLKRCAWRLG